MIIVLQKQAVVGAKTTIFPIVNFFGENIFKILTSVPGPTAGIGKETAFDLARRGARLIMLCRDTDKADKVAKEIR
jgi:hypothetical protein